MVDILNLYFVTSEILKEVIWEDWFNQLGHEEVYVIAEFVIARTPAQAKYLAWKNDSSFTYNIMDIPLMRYITLAKDLDSEPRIVTNDPDYQKYWEVL